jgi:hypothetical protein
MTYIDLPGDYSLVLRSAALNGFEINVNHISQKIDLPEYTERDGLIVFGPIFGGEACGNIQKNLESAGLSYFEDFFFIDYVLPDWCLLGARLACQ